MRNSLDEKTDYAEPLLFEYNSTNPSKQPAVEMKATPAKASLHPAVYILYLITQSSRMGVTSS